ncbi:MAG: S-layer homology domain-containing protein [Oscillospiraceae bacterium]|jgi:hypothetical protein|nr:S-layer homology domain-containing protein [Oscillospiraceae bacterium]
MKLKKTLALVLALVLAFGTLSVASAATDYTDKASIQYTEAVDVLDGIGAIEGLGDGTFNPTGTITRAQAAKMIAYTIYGEQYAKTLPLVASSFSDVTSPNYDWAIPSIEYLVDRGIIDGVGDGKFNPNSPVTGYAFLKMLLVALGYGENGEFVGIGWELGVHNYAIAVKDKDGKGVTLFRGLKGAFDGTKSATREEAALYCFNALNDLLVSYSPLLNDYTTVFSGKTLGETVYGLESKNSSDDYGVYGHKWFASVLSTDAISGFYVDDEFVATIPYGTKFSDIPKLLGTTERDNKRGLISIDNGALDKSNLYSVDTQVGAIVGSASNGKLSVSQFEGLLSTKGDWTTPGTIDVYISKDPADNPTDTTGIGKDDNGGDGYYKFVTCYEYFAQITKKTASDGKADLTIYGDGKSVKISLTGTYAKGEAFIAIPKGTDISSTSIKDKDDLISLTAATPIKGKVTGYEGSADESYVYVDGTKYTKARFTFAAPNATAGLLAFSASGYDKTDANFYLDKDGLVIAMVKIDDPAPTVYYGLAVDYDVSDYAWETGAAASEKVKFFDETGAEKTLFSALTLNDDGSIKGTPPLDGLSAASDIAPLLFAYTLNADGKIDAVKGTPAALTTSSGGTQTALPAATPAANVFVNPGAKDYYLSDSTVAFYYAKDDTVSVGVVKGFKNMVTKPARTVDYNQYAMLDLDLTGDILEAVVIDCETTLLSGLPQNKAAGFVYFASADFEVSGDYYIFKNAYVNGAKADFKLLKTGSGDVDAGETLLYRVNAKGDNVITDVTTIDIEEGVIIQREGTLFVTTGSGTVVTYTVDDDTEYYAVKSDGSLESLADKPDKDDAIIGRAPGSTAADDAIIYIPKDLITAPGV